MSRILNAVRKKLNVLKQNVMLRTVLICVLALLLIFSVTFAWYINNLGLWGMDFSTGNIDFNAYIYDNTGKRLVGPVSPDDDDASSYINAPLFSIGNAQVGTTGTVYIALESTGSIGIQYRVAFDVTGKNDNAMAYLGGYKYKVTKVTDKVAFNSTGNLNVSGSPTPEKIDDEILTIDRNAINGTIQDKNGYDIYRFDYTLAHKNEEYTSNTINFYLNIFATQIGGDFEDTAERGYTYYCATKDDLDRAKVEAYPGDIIKLTSNIIYYGDLVFNKPINLETNDFILTVNGNLMYDYVLGNDLKIDAGGLGQVVVQCTKEGVGGNLKIKTPLSDVNLIGSNASTGDFIVEKTITIDATNAFGSPGVSFNNVRIVDEKNSRKAVLLESNTRATVSFGTTIGLLQSVVKANNIEIINNGVIGDINLSNMALLEQTNSPQIYILNNNDINNPIVLPEWSVKFVQDENGKCTGNTRIIQSYSGSAMQVSCVGVYTDDDIEVEMKDALVEQIIAGNDSRLKIYYQDIDGRVTTIQSILENYLQNEATTGCKLNEVMQLEIISIGTKAVTNADITFMNGNNMLSLKHLDMQRANIYDSNTGIANRLPNHAFSYNSKYEYLVLPQNLTAIGDNALSYNTIENPVTIPSGVQTFGTNWYYNGLYVCFASSVPQAQAASGLSGVNAIFVEEAYIESYRSVFNQNSTRIYPVSVLDEAKEHFVRNLKNDEWEITYHVRGEDAVIGKNITLDGRILKITSVYDNAYRHNFTLSEVNFEDTVVNLGASNFYNNKTITKVNLKKIKTIGNSAFSNCSNVVEVVFNDCLEVIGDSAFLQCTGLKQEVVLPGTMKSIGASAFRMTPITYIHGGGTTSVEYMAFYGCSALVAADLPNVKTVAESGSNDVFGYCTKLVSVDLSSAEKVGGGRMFQACSSLREIYMGADAESVSLGTSTFLGISTDKIKVFVPEEQVSFYQSKRPGNLNAYCIYPKGEKMDEELVNGFNIGRYVVLKRDNGSYVLVTSNIDHKGKYTIPASYEGSPITEIFNNCFRNQGFTEVELTLGNNIKNIGNYAFYGRNGIISVSFGNSVETIGSYAFAYCSGLAHDIILPASMRTIGSYAFNYTLITGVKTGGTTFIDDHAFYFCNGLIYADLPEVTKIGNSSANEVFASSPYLVSVDMPKVAEVYGSKMFTYCTSLSEIFMGSMNPGVSLGSTPFTNIDSTKIKLYVPEESVSFYTGRNLLNSQQVYPRGERFGDHAVNGYVIGDYIMLRNDEGYTLVTSNLQFSGTVTVPSVYKDLPITKICFNAFRNQSFTDVNMILGSHVTEIGASAFRGVTGLSLITLDNVQTIGSYAFYTSGLKVLNGPAVIEIGERAFEKCTALTTVNLPVLENITGAYTFGQCTALKMVYFENVKSLHTNTFTYCNKIENITINRLIDAEGSNMPSKITIESSAPCKIYVPYRSLSAYGSTWSGKPVVSFDIAVKDSGHTYILTEDSAGRYAVLDFMPGSSVSALTLPATVSSNGTNITIYGIREGAFATAAGTLKSVTLSATIGQLYNGALTECNMLENIYVNAANQYFTSIGGVLYSKDSKMLVKYPAGRSGKFDMTAANYNSTVGISATAFGNANGLTEIVFPASLLMIDSSAFENCTKLHTVTFTGNTPPILMGNGIFDTSVDGFKMVIPTTTNSVVTAYLCAFNFGEYEPYIDRGGYSAPSSSTARNQVHASAAASQAVIETIDIEEDEEA